MVSFSMVLGVLAVIAVIIFFAAGMIAGDDSNTDPARSEKLAAEVNERIRPASYVVVAGSAQAEAEAQQTVAAATPPAAAGAQSGLDAYNSGCNACHAAGVLNAPKTGDNAIWASRYDEKGLDQLVHNAINGINSMPAKGGNTALSDDNVRAAVIYMLGESGINADAGANAAAEPEPAEPEPATETPTEPTQTAAVEPQPVAEPESAEPEPATEPVAAVTPPANTTASAPTTLALPDGLDLQKGQSTYEIACVVCHQAGVAGAPKLGDKAAWEARNAQGWDTLVEHVIKGFKGMPPKGGRMDLSDDDILSALGYMVSESL